MRKRLRALTLAAVAGSLPGCKIPYESLSVCTGLKPGDLLDIRIDAPGKPTGGTLTECDPRLGFFVGATFSTTIAEAGHEGCGLTVGPIDVPESSVAYEFDLGMSNEFGDERTHSWANASAATTVECEGDLLMLLYNVDPESIAPTSRGELSVRHQTVSDGDCPKACDFGFDVTITKRE